MSIQIMADVWANATDVSGGELVILLALADHASDQGKCWPAMHTLAKKARMSERNARSAVRKLEAKGYVNTKAGGGKRSSTYIIGGKKLPSSVNSGGKSEAGRGEAGIRGGGKPTSEESSYESPREPSSSGQAPDPTHPAQDFSLSSKPSLEESGAAPDGKPLTNSAQQPDTPKKPRGCPTIDDPLSRGKDKGSPPPSPAKAKAGRSAGGTARKVAYPWLAEAVELWKKFGLFEYGTVCKGLKPVAEEVGDEQMMIAFRAYIEKSEPQFMPAPWKFKGCFRQYLPPAPPPPVVCEDPNVVFARQRLSCKVEDLVRPDTEKEEEEKRREHEAYMKRCR